MSKVRDRLNFDAPLESLPFQKEAFIKKKYLQLTPHQYLKLKAPKEDIFDFCLTDPEDPEETILELSRPNRLG
jgi:hypothetical protein